MMIDWIQGDKFSSLVSENVFFSKTEDVNNFFEKCEKNRPFILISHNGDGSITTNLKIKKMSYDGRLPEIPWRSQNIDEVGYHYYMTPETAQLGLNKLQKAIEEIPRKWSIKDWPDLTEMEIFKKK